MQIASDEHKRMWIHSAPNEPVTLQFILKDLWPKLGFLPIDPENPGVALVAEFMLNELILKNSESLEELDLNHLKELFSGDEDEGLEGIEDEMDEMQDLRLQRVGRFAVRVNEHVIVPFLVSILPVSCAEVSDCIASSDRCDLFTFAWI